MEWQMTGILILVMLLAFVFLGTPIFAALGITSIIGLTFVIGTAGWAALPRIMFSSVNEFVLTCIPMFILLGEIVGRSGLGDSLYDAAYKWVGRVSGGLAIAAIVAEAAFGAVIGTAAGVAIVVGALACPQMLKYGYDKRLAGGTVAGCSGLGLLIPPSISAIMYGIITENSIGKLFIAGVGPGVMLVVLYSLYVYIRVKTRPALAPISAESFPLKEKVASLGHGGVWAVVIIVLVIIGGIYGGMMTPTEAAGGGAFAAFLVALAYRKLNRRNMKEILYRTVRSTGLVFVILVNAKIFGYLLAVSRVPQNLASAVIASEATPWMIFTATMALLFVLGLFMDVTPIILISMPICYPIIVGLGYDPIWYGAMVTVNMCMAVVTPPVGLAAIMLSPVSGIPVEEIMRGCMPYVIIDMAAIVLIYVFPQIALWLPSMMTAR